MHVMWWMPSICMVAATTLRGREEAVQYASPTARYARRLERARGSASLSTRRMASTRFMRAPADTEQRATFLELFFDLVFVFAVTQLSHRLLRHLTVAGAAQTLLLLLVVWWAWIYTTWMTNWFDPDSVPVRVTLLAGMLASLVIGIAIPQAFGSRALPFAAGYVSLQVVRNLFIVAATKPESPLHVGFRRMLAWSAWTGVIWIAGALEHGEARVIVWIVALVADYAGPFAG